MDLSAYAAMAGGPIDYNGWFPLVRAPWLISLLERAYLAIFAEIALVLTLLAPNTALTRNFVGRLATCYGVGLAAFLLWPVAGPCLVYPASIDPILTGASTRAIMQGMSVEFELVLAAGQPVTGFAYFVALPSLQFAMAVLRPVTVQTHSRVGGPVVAPINILMIVSTFVLGYHYLIDVPTGALLGAAVVALLPSRELRARNQPAIRSGPELRPA